MSYQVGTASNESAIPRINLAIGPSCPVRCEGCYNRFNQSEIVSAHHVVSFARAAANIGIRRSIVSGGDPLSHPSIVEILGGLGETMDHVRMDTVGTAFLPGAGKVPIVYKGRGFMDTYNPEQFKGSVSLINIPMDGAEESTAQRFRHGRRSQVLAEARIIAGRITAAEIPLGINTVVNRHNIGEIPRMLEIVRGLGACQWRLFQFDPAGPNPSKHASELVIPEADFIATTEEVRAASGEIAIFAGAVNNRGTYHMVDSAGFFYERTPGVGMNVIGHIARDSEVVISSLQARVEMLYDQQQHS